MHQQNLLRQQHLLIQFQQAELMRLQEEAARHRQCAEEAAAQATSCRSADVSPPHGAAVGWWFSPHAPEKRLAEERRGARLSILLYFSRRGHLSLVRGRDVSAAVLSHRTQASSLLGFLSENSFFPLQLQRQVGRIVQLDVGPAAGCKLHGAAELLRMHVNGRVAVPALGSRWAALGTRAKAAKRGSI